MRTASSSFSASNSWHQSLMMASTMASFASSDSTFSTSDGIPDSPVPFPLGHPKIASDRSFLDGSAPQMKLTIFSIFTCMSSWLKTSMKNSPRMLAVSLSFLASFPSLSLSFDRVSRLWCPLTHATISSIAFHVSPPSTFSMCASVMHFTMWFSHVILHALTVFFQVFSHFLEVPPFILII